MTLIAYAETYQAYVLGEGLPADRIPLGRGNDFTNALWTGLRAALAVAIVGSFWIFSNWPHGSTAVILAAVATARLATMGHAVPVSAAATFIFSLATIPAFVIVDVLLPLASGFEMFALVVAPVIFCCALLMANKKVEIQLIGFFSGLLFASVGSFQDRMVYDPVGLLNTSIAAVAAAGTASVLWSVFAPDTPEAARARFRRVARQALATATAGRLAEFETAMADALFQLQSYLRPDRPDDKAALKAAIEDLVTGREMIAAIAASRSSEAFAHHPSDGELSHAA
jgi:uncharacterized membrane protein YccC